MMGQNVNVMLREGLYEKVGHWFWFSHYPIAENCSDGKLSALNASTNQGPLIIVRLFHIPKRDIRQWKIIILYHKT